MKNSEYWQERFKQLEEAQNEIASNSRAEIERQYRQAVRDIEGKIDTWYRKLGVNNISMAEASKPLSDSELADFKWDVYDYIKYGEENALSGQWIKQLEYISNQLYISKYDELRVHTQQSLESLFAKQYGITTEAMKKVYQSGYYHTAFEIQRGFGVGWDISGIDQNQLEKVIAKPWVADGKNFSERIWINKQGLIDEVDDQLTQHIIRGDNPQRAIDAIANNMNVYKSNAARIVMTEGAYFGSAAQRECFEELGIEEYEIIATMDKHTSEICRGRDGKRFAVKEFRVGVTAPPFHPWCRSTVCPCFDEGFGERTGSCCISEDISYEDWKERFVEGGDKMRFAAVDKLGDGGIINAGAISGAINPNSKAAEKHAILYYESVRHMTTDTKRISEFTHISQEKIDKIKNHVFIQEHDLFTGHRRFDPSYEMAQSWQRLISGKFKEMDIILLKHEYAELRYMEKGLSQDEAHILASKKYNYSKYCE